MSEVAVLQRQPQRDARSSEAGASARLPSVCHFTTAHTALKSRSFHRQCLPLAEAGFPVSFVAPIPHADTGPVALCSLPRRRNRIRRSIVNLLRALLNQQAGLYHFQDPELLPLALVLKIIFGKRVVYDAYEDFPSMARASGSIPRALRPLASKSIAILESIAARCLDGLMTADPFTLRRLARTGGSRKLVFHNFPNLDFFPEPTPLPKVFDLVYRGGISERSGTYVLLDAMKLLANQSRRVQALLIGYFDSCGEEMRLRERVRALGLESQVEVRGRIAHEEMAAALSQARIGVCPLQAVPKFLLNIPVKVFEYWACGLPVVASDLPPIRPYFRGTEGGLLFRAGSASQFAHSLAWLLDHPGAAAQMGRNGRAAIVERFNNAAEVRRLKRYFVKIAATESARSEDFADARTPCEI